MTREPQLYDTISKGGVFWRIVSIENGVITAKRLHGAGNGQKHKAGRPAVKDLVLVILIGGLSAFAAFFPPWLSDYIDDRKSREFWEKKRKEGRS